MSMRKPNLTFSQVLSMNAGFFGIQFSFGLQQSSMSPIYKYLGADEASLPYLWLAGPVTGLIVQPIIGAMSDRTVTRWGRRKPYFFAGAIVCSLGLLLMPFSSALWMAASLLWILDAANNVTMEPYRAFVSDKLDTRQHSLGFLTQSALTGLGQTLAYLTPTLFVLLGMNKNAVNASNIPLITIAAFMTGAVFSIASIGWTLATTPEIAMTPEQIAAARNAPRGLLHTLEEIRQAIVEMPQTMRQLIPVCLLQWYAMFCYWQYIVLSLSRTLFGTTDAMSPAFRDAGLINGHLGGFYNFVACIAAFAMATFTPRLGPKMMHGVCLAAAGCGMLAIPLIHGEALLFVPMIGVGLAWASIMGNPYIMLAGCIPPQRTGVYMGIFNMFIVIPMLIQIMTLPLYYHSILGGNPENVIRLAGVLMIFAAVSVLFVKSSQPALSTASQA